VICVIRRGMALLFNNLETKFLLTVDGGEMGGDGLEIVPSNTITCCLISSAVMPVAAGLSATKRYFSCFAFFFSILSAKRAD
jgi:hypothetical protein